MAPVMTLVEKEATKHLIMMNKTFFDHAGTSFFRCIMYTNNPELFIIMS